jgi:hypothetical protein
MIVLNFPFSKKIMTNSNLANNCAIENLIMTNTARRTV